jgi:hypothetical protein
MYMHLQDFLSHKLIALPIARDTTDFLSFVSTRLESFLGLIDQLDGPGTLAAQVKAEKPKLEEFCKLAIKSVTAALTGLPHDAYIELVEGVKLLLPYLENDHLAELTSDNLGFVYRVRKQVSPPLSREEIFHVPYESRHKVATQRYSVPGLPCLYLGGSLLTCWAEMGEPAFHKLQASAFWLSPPSNVKVINFTNRPVRLARLLVQADGSYPPDKEDYLRAHIMLWPLMALCSIVVLNKDSSFKPEYIVPQILLQWITKEKKFDGVGYFSTHVEAISPKGLHTGNLVFPVREVKASGRCSWLRGIFKLTEPMSWQLLRAINLPGSYPVSSLGHEFIPGRKENYYVTEFGLVQSKLNQLALEQASFPVVGEKKIGKYSKLLGFCSV